MMKPFAFFLAVFILTALAGCKQQSITVQPACDTLTKESVSSVQGEQVIDATASQTSSGGLSISQCFYKLPTYSRSVNLEITTGPPNGIDEFWKKRFHEYRMSEEEEEELEREKEQGNKASPGAEEKKSSGPQPVSGLGDEAFWVASQINGALFVRKSNAIYRVTLGGPDGSSAKLERATALAKSFLDKK
jgi:hypothetical protein